MTDLTFTIVQPEALEGWSVWFNRNSSPEPILFIEGATYFSTVAQMVAEGLRRLEAQGASLTVVDPSGFWEHWLDHSRLGFRHTKKNVPTHSIVD